MNEDRSWRLDFDANAVVPSETSLARTQVVEDLVRVFLKSVQEWWCEAAQRTISVTVLQRRIVTEAERLQDIFYGRDPAHPAGSWNRPEELGEFLRQQSGDVWPADDAVRGLLLMLAADLCHILKALVDGEKDEEEAGWQSLALVETGRNRLLGITEAMEEAMP
jgi:hypothetical protein